MFKWKKTPAESCFRVWWRRMVGEEISQPSIRGGLGVHGV